MAASKHLDRSLMSSEFEMLRHRASALAQHDNPHV